MAPRGVARAERAHTSHDSRHFERTARRGLRLWKTCGLEQAACAKDGATVTADVETVVVGAGVVGLAIAPRARARRARGAGARAPRPHRHGDELAQLRGDPRRPLLSAGQPARQAVRRRQGAALRLLRGERRRPPALRQAAGRARRTDEIAKLEAIAATAAANGVDDLRACRARRRARSSRSSPASPPICRRRPASSTAAGLMLALEGHLTTLGGQVVLNTAVTRLAAPAGEAGDFTIEIASGGESEHAHRAATSCSPRASAATALGRMLAYPRGYRVPETYPAQGPLLRARRPRAVPPPRLSHAAGRLARRAPDLDVAGRAKLRPRHRMDATRVELRLRGRRRGAPRPLRARDPPLLAGPARRRAAPRQRRRAPEDLSRGRAGRRFRHPRARASTACPASSRSTASRAPA